MTPQFRETAETERSFPQSPLVWRLLVILAVAIFIAETLVMGGLAAFFPQLSILPRVLLDSLLLTIVIFPLLYLLVFRQMEAQVRRREKAERHLRALNEELEARVAERTLGLHQALAEAEGSRQQLRSILDSIGDALLVLDGEGQVVTMNPRAEDLFRCRQGWPATLREFLVDLGLVKQIEKLGERQSLEVCWTYPADRGGEERILEVKGSPLPRRDGLPGGCILLLEDITRLRELDRLKGQLVSTAAHEISTPLTAILGFSDLLLATDEELTSEQRREYLTCIQEKGESLAQLVDSLLDLGRIEEGRTLELHREPCDFHELLRRAAPPHFLHSPSHRLELQLPSRSPEIFIDKRRITQVLDNLLSNARKYSPAGGRIVVRGEMGEGVYRLSVSDEGIGMSAETRERLFEGFFRGDTSETAPGGTGIGLSIARHIIEAHGGTIRVESEVGRGTTVHLTLPLSGTA